MYEHKNAKTKQKHENHKYTKVTASQSVLALNLILTFVEKSIRKSTSSYRG